MKYPVLTGLAISSLFVQQIFQTYFAYCIKLIVDNVLNNTGSLDINWILLSLILAFIVMTAATLGGEYVNAKTGSYIFQDVRRQMYTRLQQLSADFYTRNAIGDILSRFSGDMKSLEAGYTQAFISVIFIAIGMVINSLYLFYLDWRLATLTIILMPLLFEFVRRQLPGSSISSKQLRKEEANVVNAVQETIRAHQIIKTFALESLMSGQFEAKQNQLADIATGSRFKISLISRTASIGVMLIQLCIVVAGAWLAVNGQLTVGSFVSFTAILNIMTKDFFELSRKVMPPLLEAIGGIGRIEALINAPVTIQDAPNAETFSNFHNKIHFENVTFSYTGEQINLNNINLEIPAGKSVVFVGSSGSGKSTILNLIMRFYDPQSGSVQFDGKNIAHITQKSLREQMSAVFQENYLFNTSIRENIRLGRPDASDAEIEDAARAAEIHTTIMSLPNGYETSAGEAGGRLSGGQRQRIAIARAILSNPRILLLDEATSALDPGTESAINATLEEIGKGRTVISVTHRLNSARNADQIFVMHNGLLAEQGTHDQLLAAKGVYYELWQKQSGFEVSQDGRYGRVTAERLHSVNMFAKLQVDALQEIANNFHSEYFEAGQTVISQGEAGDKAYLIVRGQVKVSAQSENGTEHFIEFLEDGDHFGEMALLTNRPRNATIQTLTPCLFLSMTRETLVSLSQTYPEISEILAARMDISVRNLRTLAR